MARRWNTLLPKMLRPPNKTDLPFFAYGIFKPGELGFLRIKEFVDGKPISCTVPGQLWVRDGLPIAHLRATRGSEISGYLIHFEPGVGFNAYARIAELEPEYQYKWNMKKPNGEDAWILEGKNPENGEIYGDWDGQQDPLFGYGLDVIEEIWEINHGVSGAYDKLFRLEAAYLLLWSAIERYASLRYHLSNRVKFKLEPIITDSAFAQALKKYVVIDKPRSVRSADNPETVWNLDPNSPRDSFQYYWQIRNNTSHRGKSAGATDHKRLTLSLDELLKIFRYLLKSAFQEAQIQ
jgi:hypothetical protein